MSAIDQLLLAFSLMMHTKFGLLPWPVLDREVVESFHQMDGWDKVGLIKWIRNASTPDHSFADIPLPCGDSELRRYDEEIDPWIEQVRRDNRPRPHLGLTEAKVWADRLIASINREEDSQSF